MSHQAAISRIALVCALALAGAAAGCSSSSLVQDKNEGGWFSKPADIFAKPDWARVTSDSKNSDLTPKGPVGPDDLVSADGRCALAVAPQPANVAPVDTVAGDLAGAPAGEPRVMGGIALGMTECQAVQRAGTPSNVAISGGDRGGRKVVLTFLTGVWPGIYHFDDGRLREIDRVAAPPAPPKVPPKKKAAAKKKTATQQ